MESNPLSVPKPLHHHNGRTATANVHFKSKLILMQNTLFTIIYSSLSLKKFFLQFKTLFGFFLFKTSQIKPHEYLL